MAGSDRILRSANRAQPAATESEDQQPDHNNSVRRRRRRAKTKSTAAGPGDALTLEQGQTQPGDGATEDEFVDFDMQAKMTIC